MIPEIRPTECRIPEEWKICCFKLREGEKAFHSQMKILTPPHSNFTATQPMDRSLQQTNIYGGATSLSHVGAERLRKLAEIVNAYDRIQQALPEIASKVSDYVTVLAFFHHVDFLLYQ